MATINQQKCPNCRQEARLVTGTEVLPHVPAVETLNFWLCAKCDFWVGCHAESTTPLGRMANANTRALKREAHQAFDALWQSGEMTRTQAYKWLQTATGLNAKECHIGWMSDQLLEMLPTLCKQRQGACPPRSP